jgi:hypothetical protein
MLDLLRFRAVAVQMLEDEMREVIIGRANVKDTPELVAYYRELEKYETGALWTGTATCGSMCFVP